MKLPISPLVLQSRASATILCLQYKGYTLRLCGRPNKKVYFIVTDAIWEPQPPPPPLAAKT